MKSFNLHCSIFLIASLFFQTVPGCRSADESVGEREVATKRAECSELARDLSGWSQQNRFSSPESKNLISSAEELMKLTLELNRELTEQQWRRMDSIVKSYQEEFQSVMDLMSTEEQNHFHVLISSYYANRERVTLSDDEHD